MIFAWLCLSPLCAYAGLLTMLHPCLCWLTHSPAVRKVDAWCDYIGKFCCSLCMSSATMAIPARIVRDWDFRRMHVSTSAVEILGELRSVPCIMTEAINATLFLQYNSTLGEYRRLRMQLFQLLQYLGRCRFATECVRRARGTAVKRGDDEEARAEARDARVKQFS